MSATPLERAKNVWQSIFAGGPYTSLRMLQYILETGKMTPEEFLKIPDLRAKSTGFTAKIIENQDIDTMAIAWQSDTGRCTSFAVKAVYTLSQEKDGDNLIYDFCIYDLGGHRIARCRNTGIVIDSSSRLKGGAFELKEGDWAIFDETSSKWKYSQSKSMFERDRVNPGKTPKSSATPITAAAAMQICFGEVVAGAWRSVPTLFRTVTPEGIATFYGMVSWTFQDRAIEMVPVLTNKKNKFVIQWAQQILGSNGQPTAVLDKTMVGTREDLEHCIATLTQFIVDYGGPDRNGPKQWAADGIGNFSAHLFEAATKLWGNPTLKEAKEAKKEKQ
ncbi:hypothetical protein C8A05DRAFT_17892 [Staphylotrichum tortipilum]|uniref:Uncharacterized protein n=1 Tax=Staphylotrichum tortipilum TaxID=2831512 RepID=A0AAN6MF30_9PEZI|nr:hypothetical protein C8A05DRAFT_17892 [Staphylotrichum longicolle]